MNKFDFVPVCHCRNRSADCSHCILTKAKVLSRNQVIHDITFIVLCFCCYPLSLIAVALFRECDS